MKVDFGCMRFTVAAVWRKMEGLDRKQPVEATAMIQIRGKGGLNGW